MTILAAALAACTATGGWRRPGTTVTAGPATIAVERVFAGGGRRGVVGWLTGRRPGPALVRPYGVAWDGDDLLVTDPGAGRVVRIGPGGRLRGGPRGGLASPVGVAVCTDGILVTDSRAGTVVRLSRGLRPAARLAEGLLRPTGIACVGGAVVVAETGAHRLVVLDPGGGRRTIGRRGSGPGEFNFPTALAADGDTVWVGDTLNFRLQRIRLADGEPLTVFGRLGDAPGELPRVKGITVDPAGRLWVTEERLDQVILFRRDGTLLATVGGSGQEPGRFAFPAGIAARPDGAVAVADSLNRRVQVLRLVVEGVGHG